MIRKAFAAALIAATLLAPNSLTSLPAVQGSTASTWTPRSYSVSSDLQGGVTGGQASSYTPTVTTSHL